MKRFRMMEQEIETALSALRAQGWRAELCDTPVPVLCPQLRCGLPSELGDVVAEDYYLLPKRVVGSRPVVLLCVEGDSMTELGIMPGDSVRVELREWADDGDVVVAELDGRVTVKVLYTDREGQRWLLPRNRAYDPLPIGPASQLRIYGVVVGVEHARPRSSARECEEVLRLMRQRQGTAKGRPQRRSLRELLAPEEAERHLQLLADAVAGRKGKAVAFALRAAMQAGWLTEKPSFEAVREAFGEVGARSNFDRYMALPMSDEEMLMAMRSIRGC